MSLSFAVSFTLASAPLEDQEENDLKMYMHTHMHTHAHTLLHVYTETHKALRDCISMDAGGDLGC